MKKIILIACAVTLGVCLVFGYMFYMVGKELAMMCRCGCHNRNF